MLRRYNEDCSEGRVVGESFDVEGSGHRSDGSDRDNVGSEKRSMENGGDPRARRLKNDKKRLRDKSE